ncbi:SUF system NifU family Fe-S cluster assembly protein [Trichocoleus sp. FACHB-90]|uniref:Fe-S cluster assembly sulfur transfer protein SufU n=1 Tax=Cyanophyceae TaxID=3028117 RepID=UPI0016825693|nr:MULTISPECIES: SUF system NifU family Fe-S cluster assembly protein [unclassified Trichocoleus]MBD1831146.1 SUF system NifU family Fe-S cluster assembly protein [Cyanobacteria bacterium FACHB-472]MBD1925156.1 SUF system NifU family Fe-S cluster assembly protein [Trichocoleus sp. FACHB-90]MBD2005925.1 SUF system NifU family Fe-S cluster assembly protein [Trichocoleus sp. FACHB-40]
MTLGNLRDLYQQVILEHYKKPRHKGKTNPVHRYQKGHNPSCGDTIELTLHLNDAGNAIEEVKFEGEGCAIAMASADLMADALRGKSVSEALEMVERFQNMMKGQAEFPKEQRKLNVMQGVSQFPVRIKCANLTWHTLKAALELPNGNSGNGFISNEKEDA